MATLQTPTPSLYAVSAVCGKKRAFRCMQFPQYAVPLYVVPLYEEKKRACIE